MTTELWHELEDKQAEKLTAGQLSLAETRPCVFATEAEVPPICTPQNLQNDCCTPTIPRTSVTEIPTIPIIRTGVTGGSVDLIRNILALQNIFNALDLLQNTNYSYLIDF